MKHEHLGRRNFLSGAVAVAGAALAPCGLRSARAQPAGVETRPLTDATIAIVGPDSTSLATRAGDGVIVVGGGHADWSDALLETITEAFGDLPVTALFNTHWHREQTGANFALGEAGVPIYAHENTRLWLGTEVRVRWSKRLSIFIWPGSAWRG